MARSRFVIGLDLGTTNTAVAYVDTRSAEQRVRVFELPQLVAPGELDTRRQLPSFVYLAGEHDLAPALTALPWDAGARNVVGELARSQGARQPERLISSSKSWLCHGAVDRHAAILPWAIEGAPKLSPVDASSLVLEHVARAWDHVHGAEADARFADQEVIVTVPASFDEAARELTLEASAKAGVGQPVLLEEPQAAFYSWLSTHAATRLLEGGDRVLVFDVGGGTTDFTLIEVTGEGRDFQRTAVGDHLLLGGDNVDLALAKTIEARLVAGAGTRKLDPLQWHGLVHACRLAKEALLANPEVLALPITVSGRGARLIGAALRDELGRAQLDHLVNDGFFPLCDKDEGPRRVRGGLQEFGLPYAADPAITRHLAAFLTRHGIPRVDAVLFNGGTMAPAALRHRVLAQLTRWQPDQGAPRELVSEAPELAVAQGAAYYGLVRRGLGTRIGGGTPRAFYVGVGDVDGRHTAVCLAARGLEEGAAVELDRDFELTTNRPVSFKLYSSTVREDVPGQLVVVMAPRSPGGSPDEPELLELPPIVTVVRARGRSAVTVHLQVRITELGALELGCVAQGGEAATFKLSFDMRAGGARAEAAGGDGPPAPDPRVPAAQALCRDILSGPGDGLSRIVKLLEEALAAPRDEWPMATARALFDATLAEEEQRRRSPEHEARWLNLTGWCLRPGVGAPLDEWRAQQMWRVFNDDLCHGNDQQCRLSWWIVWRRVAGGLNKGQQHQIYLRLAQLFLPGGKGKKRWAEIKPSAQEAAEMLRCLANLERLSVEAKLTLGDELVRRLDSRRSREEGLDLWALGRIGARVPLYGPLNCVVPPGKAADWVAALVAHPWPDPARAAFPLAQLGRRTGDRARDLPDDLRERLAARLRALGGGERAAVLIEQVVALDAREQHIALGDSLPPGLRLVASS